MARSPEQWASMFLKMKNEYNQVVVDYAQLKSERDSLVDVLVNEEKVEIITLIGLK